MTNNSFDITRVFPRYKIWGERYKKLTAEYRGYAIGFDGGKGNIGNYQDAIAVRIYNNYRGKAKGEKGYNDSPSFLNKSFKITSKVLLNYFPNPVKCLPLWYPDKWYDNANVTLKDIDSSGLQVRPDKTDGVITGTNGEKLNYTWNIGRWNHKNKDGDPVIMRHEECNSTLKDVTYFESFFNNTSPIKDINTYLFWLLKKDIADFAYAIFKYSMFKVWCNLEAAGKRDFSIGMWDTFPIQDIKKPLSQLENPSPELSEFLKTCPLKTLTVEEAIKRAGQRRKKGWKQSVFDKCMDELCGFGRIPKNYSRKQILEKNFLYAFYG